MSYAYSLRQQAAWVREAIDPATPETQRITLDDVDVDELEAAAAEIDRLTKQLVKANRALAIISYMDAQCGEDALKMRSIATDVTMWDRPDSMWWYGKNYGPGGTQWQPIDTAPRDGKPIIGYSTEGVSYVCWSRGDSWVFFEDHKGNRWHFEPTHWMPHPELPHLTDDPKRKLTGAEIRAYQEKHHVGFYDAKAALTDEDKP